MNFQHVEFYLRQKWLKVSFLRKNDLLVLNKVDCAEC